MREPWWPPRDQRNGRSIRVRFSECLLSWCPKPSVPHPGGTLGPDQDSKAQRDAGTNEAIATMLGKHSNKRSDLPDSLDRKTISLEVRPAGEPVLKPKPHPNCGVKGSKGLRFYRGKPIYLQVAKRPNCTIEGNHPQPRTSPEPAVDSTVQNAPERPNSRLKVERRR